MSPASLEALKVLEPSVTFEAGNGHHAVYDISEANPLAIGEVRGFLKRNGTSVFMMSGPNGFSGKIKNVKNIFGQLTRDLGLQLDIQEIPEEANQRKVLNFVTEGLSRREATRLIIVSLFQMGPVVSLFKKSPSIPNELGFWGFGFGNANHTVESRLFPNGFYDPAA